MLATTAYAQTAGAAAANDGGLMGALISYSPLILIVILGYFLLIRPQQQRQREHRNAVSAVKRGDSVVLSSGMIGKVVRVEEAEVGVEIAQGVTVKVVKDMIHVVRSRGEPAPANDSSRAKPKPKS
ncbi:MAG TPA: preprotein translocase subunit YajC [Caulobacteraceae bacterium]|nr:preprotein translocase subunit YajC [Caulobacteraceae bacterium]